MNSTTYYRGEEHNAPIRAAQHPSNGFFQQVLDSFDRHYQRYLAFILLLAVVNLFLGLGINPVNDWDEARHGVTAYEMLQNHNFIVSTYSGEVDLYNFKPPLGMWLIAAAYKLFGYNAFAMRFFSALNALFTIALTMRITRQATTRRTAILAGLVLATALPFFSAHSGRTGDVDATLTLLTLASTLCMVKAPQDKRYFYLGALVFSVAFLLKGFASGQIALLWFAWAMWDKQYRLLTFKRFAACLALVLLPILTWAAVRLQYTGGKDFLEGMVLYDVLKRSSQGIEGNGRPFYFYVKYLIERNPLWTLLVIVLAASLPKLRFQDRQQRNFAVVMLLSVLLPLALFSLPKTKLEWYINPVYPPLAILTALYIAHGMRHYGRKAGIALALSVLLAFSLSEATLLVRANNHKITASQRLLQSLDKVQPAQGKILYAMDWHQSDLFTAEVLRGYHTKLIGSIVQFQAQKTPGALLLLPNNPSNTQAIKQQHLPVRQMNDEWMLVGQN